MSAYSLLSSMRSATGATMRDIVAGAPPLGPLVVRCGVSELSGRRWGRPAQGIPMVRCGRHTRAWQGPRVVSIGIPYAAR